MASRFSIAGLLPTLQKDLNRLEFAEGPSVPFERAKVERIIAKLVERPE